VGFEKFKLDDRIIGVLDLLELSNPTPIQESLIPILKQNANVIASAKTGSGKTLAFLLPILDTIISQPIKHHYPRVFILAPTKELASQIYEVVGYFTKALGLNRALLQGGANISYEKKLLKNGSDIIVATPQRAKVHIQNRDFDIKSIKHFVIDEADMAFDMGFVGFIEEFLSQISKNAQKVIVSATITPRVVKLAKTYIKPIRRIEIDATNKVSDNVTHHIYPVLKSKKDELLSWMISNNNYGKVLLFVRKKEIANQLETKLKEWGYQVGVLHGEKMHNERKKALNAFKNGKLDILIATDIAARGLDIDGLNIVISYDIPHIKQDFIHRVGRTGRANNQGIAITLVSLDEIEQLKDLYKLLGEKIQEIILDDYAPKIVKARRYLLQAPQRHRKKPNKKPKKETSPLNKRGKKRKTTKRDGFKIYDMNKKKK
jgi:ATP-dependent RNA helicase RhlE